MNYRREFHGWSAVAATLLLLLGGVVAIKAIGGGISVLLENLIP